VSSVHGGDTLRARQFASAELRFCWNASQNSANHWQTANHWHSANHRQSCAALATLLAYLTPHFGSVFNYQASEKLYKTKTQRH
jgi:hypothetical protein